MENEEIIEKIKNTLDNKLDVERSEAYFICKNLSEHYWDEWNESADEEFDDEEEDFIFDGKDDDDTEVSSQKSDSDLDSELKTDSEDSDDDEADKALSQDDLNNKMDKVIEKEAYSAAVQRPKMILNKEKKKDKKE